MITRIISGLIGILLAVFIIQTGGITFQLSVLILALIGWREYVSAYSNIAVKIPIRIGYLIIPILIFISTNGTYQYILPFVLFTTLLVLSLPVLCHKTFSVNQATISLTGLFYIGIPFAHICLLRSINQNTFIQVPVLGSIDLGCALLWLALLGTWASDTFAYFTGFFIGKHKLCPLISPKKTIEGFIGGSLGTIMTVYFVGSIMSLPSTKIILLGIIISLIAPLGDLVESILKRYTGIKDSGALMPGHGGVLDRFDSVIFTVPFVYYYFKFFLSI